MGSRGLRAVRPCPGIPAFSCGMLSVRLDPFGSAPGRLWLQVAVSDVAAAPRGVLVLLTGGPGEPGVPFVSRLAGRLGPALRGYRLVMFDQRGTGAGALGCPALQQEMGASDLTVPRPDAVRSCAAAIGPGRRYFATADTVADIEALRKVLAVRRLALDGVSYGSYVAEQFALAHPAQVSRLVLDSVVPTWNVDPLQLASMRQTATVLRAACAARGCAFDPAADLAAVVRRYHDGPALLDTLVAMSVGDPAFPGVPEVLHAAAAGRPAALSALIARVHVGDAATAGQLSQGLHASTLCADMQMPWGGPDTPLAQRPAALARAVARLKPAQVWPFDRATAAGNGFIRTCLCGAGCVARLGAAGSLDTTFSGDGKKAFSWGAPYWLHPSAGDVAVARINASGSPDTRFGAAGKTTVDFGAAIFGYAVALQPNGRIVIAGQRTGANDFAVVRLLG